jgi:hypothetical protein
VWKWFFAAMRGKDCWAVFTANFNHEYIPGKQIPDEPLYFLPWFNAL